MRRTRILAAATAAVLAVAAVLIPASAAHALASGAGWSGSWSHYLDDNYTFNATPPGVRVVMPASGRPLPTLAPSTTPRLVPPALPIPSRCGGCEALHVSVCQTDRSGRCVLIVVPEPT